MSLTSFLKRSLRDPVYPYRKLTWGLLQLVPERTVRSRTKNGHLNYSSRDEIIGKSLHLLREFDYRDIERSFELLSIRKPRAVPADVLLDIGANIGTVCIPMMVSGMFKRALAFEPEPKNYEILADNLALNGLENRITALPVGLSSENRDSMIYKSKINFGDHRVVNDQDFAGGREAVGITLRRLDDVLVESKIDPRAIGFICLDTQGHDLEVLRGAGEVLRHSPPLLMEIWPWGIEANGSKPGEVVGLLSAHYGSFYDFRSEEAPRVKPIDAFASLLGELRTKDDYCNVLFV